MRKNNLTLTLINIAIIMFSAGIVMAQTNVSGPVNGIWTLYGNPYIVTGDINVQNGDSLTIEPEVEVRFDGFYQFIVDGTLSSIGTVSNPIIFTSNQNNPNPGDWYNIAKNFGIEPKIVKVIKVNYNV